jgi:hypothetical protein
VRANRSGRGSAAAAIFVATILGAAPLRGQMAPKLAPQRTVTGRTSTSSPTSSPPRVASVVPAALASEGARAALLAALVATDDGTADEQIIRFEPRTPHAAGDVNGRFHVGLATRVKSPADRIVAALADPSIYQRAVPAFVRADVQAVGPQAPAALAKAASSAASTARAQLIAWELEVPLWNLEGQLWLHPRPDGAILDLVAGDLTPGHLELTVLGGDERGAILVLGGTVNLASANWITRRLVARDPQAAPAMVATALYVLLRGLGLELERAASTPGAHAGPRRWPTAPAQAPALRVIDANAFGQRVASVTSSQRPGDFPAASSFARVISRADGRLDRIEVAVPLAVPGATATDRVLEPQRWRALPGWKHITPDANRAELVWKIDAGLPFVDFDASWTIVRQRPFRAEARGGDWTGAIIGIDIAETAGPPRLLFTTNPRVDRTGFIPRRLIAAEPLLEHGLGLGLAFVNAEALARALGPGASMGGAARP